MSIEIETVFENGVLRPLQPLHLPEQKRVTVTIEEVESGNEGHIQVDFVLPPDRWQAFCDALDAPPRDLPALRKLLTQPSLFDGNGSAGR